MKYLNELFGAYKDIGKATLECFVTWLIQFLVLIKVGLEILSFLMILVFLPLFCAAKSLDDHITKYKDNK